MKKFLLALILGLLWCNVGFAGEKEPGKDSKCLKEVKKIIKEAL